MSTFMQTLDNLRVGLLIVIGSTICVAGCEQEPSEMLSRLEKIEKDACACAGPGIDLGLAPSSEPPKCAKDAALQLGAFGYSMQGKKESERDISRAVDHISRIESCLSRVMPREDIPQLRAQLE